MQHWKDAYLELCTMLKDAASEIKWIDLWHDQITYLEEEYAFRFPAVFIGFRFPTISDFKDGIQDLNGYIEFTVAYHTLADTYDGSENQESALKFADLLTKLHKNLQAKAGTNFSALKRREILPLETGSNLIVYRLTYATIIRDYSPLEEEEAGKIQKKVTLDKIEDAPPAQPPSNPMFRVE